MTEYFETGSKVDTKLTAGGKFGNDGGVDTKRHHVETFGNDGHVDTKCKADLTFGNDSGGVDIKSEARFASGNDRGRVGFIRVRKRKLKGGHRQWRAARAGMGTLAATSVSFDLVRAVRVGGKPRHQFVLGFGSQKDTATGRDAAHMLMLAIGRMKRHGLDEPQCRALLTELIRKGVRRPTVAEVEGWNHCGWLTTRVDELVAWLRASP